MMNGLCAALGAYCWRSRRSTLRNGSDASENKAAVVTGNGHRFCGARRLPNEARGSQLSDQSRPAPAPHAEFPINAIRFWMVTLPTRVSNARDEAVSHFGSLDI